MPLKVAINGFGRIGRLVFRILTELHAKDVVVVAINDLVPAENLAYLLKFDSVHRQRPFRHSVEGDSIVVDGKKTSSFRKRP